MADSDDDARLAKKRVRDGVMLDDEDASGNAAKMRKLDSGNPEPVSLSSRAANTLQRSHIVWTMMLPAIFGTDGPAILPDDYTSDQVLELMLTLGEALSPLMALVHNAIAPHRNAWWIIVHAMQCRCVRTVQWNLEQPRLDDVEYDEIDAAIDDATIAACMHADRAAIFTLGTRAYELTLSYLPPRTAAEEVRSAERAFLACFAGESPELAGDMMHALCTKPHQSTTGLILCAAKTMAKYGSGPTLDAAIDQLPPGTEINYTKLLHSIAQRGDVAMGQRLVAKLRAHHVVGAQLRKKKFAWVCVAATCHNVGFLTVLTDIRKAIATSGVEECDWNDAVWNFLASPATQDDLPRALKQVPYIVGRVITEYVLRHADKVSPCMMAQFIAGLYGINDVESAKLVLAKFSASSEVKFVDTRVAIDAFVATCRDDSRLDAAKWIFGIISRTVADGIHGNIEQIMLHRVAAVGTTTAFTWLFDTLCSDNVDVFLVGNRFSGLMDSRPDVITLVVSEDPMILDIYAWIKRGIWRADHIRWRRAPIVVEFQSPSVFAVACSYGRTEIVRLMVHRLRCQKPVKPYCRQVALVGCALACANGYLGIARILHGAFSFTADEMRVFIDAWAISRANGYRYVTNWLKSEFKIKTRALARLATMQIEKTLTQQRLYKPYKEPESQHI